MPDGRWRVGDRDDRLGDAATRAIQRLEQVADDLQHRIEESVEAGKRALTELRSDARPMSQGKWLAVRAILLIAVFGYLGWQVIRFARPPVSEAPIALAIVAVIGALLTAGLGTYPVVEDDGRISDAPGEIRELLERWSASAECKRRVVLTLRYLGTSLFIIGAGLGIWQLYKDAEEKANSAAQLADLGSTNTEAGSASRNTAMVLHTRIDSLAREMEKALSAPKEGASESTSFSAGSEPDSAVDPVPLEPIHR
jgi:hypothetical protein